MHNISHSQFSHEHRVSLALSSGTMGGLYGAVLGVVFAFVVVGVAVMLVTGGVTACVIYCFHVRFARGGQNGKYYIQLI